MGAYEDFVDATNAFVVWFRSVKQPPQKPTSSELEMLPARWTSGPSTVREVHDSLKAKRAAGYTSVLGLVFLLALILSQPCYATDTACHAAGLTQYVGKYLPAQWNNEGFIDIRIREGSLMFAPPFWRPARLLVPIGQDLFQLENFKERQFHFLRDDEGCVFALSTTGTPFPGQLQRVSPTTALPLELLQQGKIQEAMPELLRQSSRDPKKLVEIGREMLGIPTQIPNARSYLEALRLAFPGDADVLVAVADAQIAEGNRGAARLSLRAAREADPKSNDAMRDLEMLGEIASTENAGWRLPFRLDDVFKSTSQAEIHSVVNEWAKRDLSVDSLQVSSLEKISVNGQSFELKVVVHKIHGVKHVGVILLPEGARKGKTPILMEAKGVSWSFFPLEVPNGLTLADVMGEDLGKFIVVAPGYRGEEVVAGGKSYKSEGDPWDAFDGATDDLLGMLNVALTLPEADSSHICVFGHSRGGTVALLAGIRDGRIRCVATWAAPTDWFQLMGKHGWSVEELVADALRHKSERSTGGQYVGFFFKPALDGSQSLQQLKMHMIASSPLYFADRLPLTQVHYGIDDDWVPERNGRELLLASQKANKPKECREAFFHPDAGHDQDVVVTPKQTREFILRASGLASEPFPTAGISCK